MRYLLLVLVLSSVVSCGKRMEAVDYSFETNLPLPAPSVASPDVVVTVVNTNNVVQDVVVSMPQPLAEWVAVSWPKCTQKHKKAFCKRYCTHKLCKGH